MMQNATNLSNIIMRHEGKGKVRELYGQHDFELAGLGSRYKCGQSHSAIITHKAVNHLHGIFPLELGIELN
jgi:hypothetical protein